jgi:diguanylate cyclase (GGDEF)-like protein/PAS domain S-box-containing protein
VEGVKRRSVVKNSPINDRKKETSPEEKILYRALFKSTRIAMVVVDEDTMIALANPEFEKLSGCSRKDLEGQKKWTEFFVNDDPSKITEYQDFIADQAKRGRVSNNHESKFIDSKGKTRDVFALNDSLIGTNKRVISFIDMTEVIREKEKTRLSEKKYRSLIESTDDSVYMVDADCRYLFVNEKVLARLNITEKKIIGKRYRNFHDLNDAMEFSGYVSKVFEMGSSCQYEYKSRREERYTLRTLSPIIEEHSKKIKCIAVVSKDITDLKKTEERLKYLSLHDPLTGLYNRAYFEEEIHRLDNSRFELVGLIVCDIDGLKLINDSLGHNKGDDLLIAASRVIRESFREGDVVARVGGDEFAILLPNSPRSKVENICQRIKRAVQAYSKNVLLPLSIATGFAIRNGPNQSMVELYREADNNMYKEKLYSSQNARNMIVKNLINTVEVSGLTDKRSLERFQKRVIDLARAVGMAEERIKGLSLLAQFHDIGNVSIHDRILHKPGDLTLEEFSEIQKHSDIGHRIAQSAPDLVHISDYILKHHEWWNGNGYPLGLKGDAIPLESRIVAIVDAYEAMTHARPHRSPMSKREVIKELNKCAGTQFDPYLVEKFIEIVGK